MTMVVCVCARRCCAHACVCLFFKRLLGACVCVACRFARHRHHHYIALSLKCTTVAKCGKKQVRWRLFFEGGQLNKYPPALANGVKRVVYVCTKYASALWKGGRDGVSKRQPASLETGNAPARGGKQKCFRRRGIGDVDCFLQKKGRKCVSARVRGERARARTRRRRRRRQQQDNGRTATRRGLHVDERKKGGAKLTPTQIGGRGGVHMSVHVPDAI